MYCRSLCSFFSRGQFVCLHNRATLGMLPHCKSNSMKSDNKHVVCNSGHVIVLSKHAPSPSVTLKHAKVHMKVSSTCFSYCQHYSSNQSISIH